MFFKKKKSSIHPTEFDLALAEGSDCKPCRCDDCYKFETIADWNSVDGGFTVKARYYVDGVEKIDTIENAIAEIKGYK